MLKYYLLIAFRNIVRYKAFTAINILGLSIGLACSILIYIWVKDELSFDRYHENAEYIYRVYEKQYYSGEETFLVFATPEPLAKALKQDIPEIVNATRLNLFWEKLLVRYEDKVFNETRGYAADQEALEMFTYPFIEGDLATALTNPHSIVMTRSMANKYFGNESPLGKSLTINNKYILTVTGVMEDVPMNSHVRWEFLVPFEFMLEVWEYPEGLWSSNSFRTYIQVRPGITKEEVEKKIIDFVQKHHETDIELYLQPLLKTHLHSIQGGGLIQYVNIFTIVAVFILFIACINFMNLSTARSSRRAKEVGIRKVSGATRTKLIAQFYGESIFLTLTAAIIAVILVKLLIVPFNELSAKELEFRLSNPVMMAVICLIVLITAIFAGSYPAQFLSSFKASDVIKGTYRIGSSFFRKMLVVVQFSISITLIICTMIIYKQLQQISNKDLGFDKNNLLYFSLRDFSNYSAFKEALLKYPGVENVTATNRVPVTMTNSSWRYSWEEKDPELEILFQQIYVDFDYTETFRMEIVEGRSFSPQFATDTVNFIINEEAVRRMGITGPIGKILYYGNSQGQIIGVVKNFNFHHLSRAIDPVILSLDPDYFTEVVIRISPDNHDNTIKEIEKIWNNYYTGEPFDYQFLDEELDQMYRPEQRMGIVFNLFSLLAILISCMGLFGMASFMAEQRTKEIGIRKTYGSSLFNIFMLINGRFVKWILLANLIAWPVAWFSMNHWLENYAYRTSISWWIFPIAAAISIIIGFVTVTYQSLRTAATNPAETLHYE
jgi:ABC-type antimicrobial peptide transport system permease subunit